MEQYSLGHQITNSVYYTTRRTLICTLICNRISNEPYSNFPRQEYLNTNTSNLQLNCTSACRQIFCNYVLVFFC